MRVEYKLRANLLSDTLTSSTDSQDIGTWQNPAGAWGTAISTSSANDIIVDTHDKEAWPSIGDQSETASDTGDTDSTSVKTLSVISSSSNPEQTQVNRMLQSTSATQRQNTSSVWGNSSLNSNRSDQQKVESGAWGSTLGSASQINSTGWSESHPSSSVNNQDLMQSGQSATSGSDSDINTLHNRIPGATWGLNNAAVGNNGKPNTMSEQEHGVTSSGALTLNNGPTLTDSQSGSNNAMSWQGINFSSPGLPGLQKDQAAISASAWGNVSAGNSVIGSGLGISTTAGSSFSMEPNSKMYQWGSSQSSGSSLGWNTPTPSSASQPEPSGWGSPCPSPNPGAGTEAWGAPDNKNNPPQAWGQPNSKANSSTPTGWSQSDAKSTPPASGGWGDVPADSSSQMSSGWGQPPPKSSPSPWGQSSQSTTPPQWASGGAANPPVSQPSGWGAGAAGATIPAAASQGAWGGGGPVGTKPPPAPSQQSQPTSWAQAAGRGLYAQQQSKPPTPSAVNPVAPQSDPKDHFIAQAVNSHDGWGKRPIRQDTSWELEDSPKLRRRNSNTEIENPSSHWDNNKGTAIWEASKGSAGPPPPPQWDNSGNRGAAGGADWGRDNDSGHWNGPPGENSSNQWNGPQHSSNQWSGGSGGSNWGGERRDGSGDRTSGRESSHWGGGSSSSNSWDSSKSDGAWGSGREDNIWDRNGTNAWGSNSKVETGMWGGSRQRRGSSSSWGDDGIEPGGWEEPDGHVGAVPGHQRQNSGSSVDDGTSYWGDPTSHRPANWNSQPGAPGVGPPRGPPAPDDKIGMWGGPANSKPSSSWGDQKLDDGPYWGQNQPPQVRGKKMTSDLEKEISFSSGYGKLSNCAILTMHLKCCFRFRTKAGEPRTTSGAV